MSYVGRFAPSPTGALHIGSLATAVGSFLDARAAHGRWLVRIEDIDLPRCVPGAADDILRTLEAFALDWDGEVVCQSRRMALYRAALADLAEKGLVYPCTCSRKKIAAAAKTGADGFVYPGFCRKMPPENLQAASAVRLVVPQENVAFADRICGKYAQNLARDVGDFVLKRADGMWAYQLAVVVDDADQGISDIVRGQDLLISTPRQIYLQRCLNFPAPRYAHLPLWVNGAGQKWSKQTHAPALDLRRKEALLHEVLASFRLPETIAPDTCARMLAAAQAQWTLENLKNIQSVSENKKTK